MQAETREHAPQTIGVLYGFRALMVLFVCNYHFWQQGWLGQYATLFGVSLDFDFWTRSSYLFVDGMILLSGFLLYLPHARQAAYGAPAVSAKRFYWNRLTRIAPSYLVSVLVMLFAFALPGGAYRDAASRNFDVLTHLTFTFTFFQETYLFTPINGVLWTVAIEVQFYLIFPLLVKAMRRKPALTLCAMGAVGVLFRLLVAGANVELAMWVNQLPALLDVYALGMLGAILYVRVDRWLQGLPARDPARRVTAVASAALFAAGCWLLAGILRLQSDGGLAGQTQLHLWQWLLRLPLALTMLLLMLSAAFMPSALQKLLDNRLMRFLATISFNLYLWHQVLSVQMARRLFPATLQSDPQLQVIFTLLCFAVSLLVAMAATFGVEQPAARRMERLRIQYHQNKEKKNHEGSSGTEALPPTDPLLVRAHEGSAGTD